MSLTRKDNLQRSWYYSAITVTSTEKGSEHFECRTLKTQRLYYNHKIFTLIRVHGIDCHHLIYHTLLKDWYNGSPLDLISSQGQLSIAIYYYVNTDSTFLISDESTWKGLGSIAIRIQNQMLILTAWNFKLEGNVKDCLWWEFSHFCFCPWPKLTLKQLFS